MSKRAYKHIPVSQPLMGKRERAYVNDALKKTAISGTSGEYLRRFEENFSRYCGCRHGVSTTSGTTALHLALIALNIGNGDEVLVSTLTNMATIFAIVYQGAKPVPVDIEPDTLNLNPSLLAPKITRQTKAILAVHLFGHPVDMKPVLDIAKKHNLYVIEDGAEAHGALYKGRKAGSLGHIGCFSFYANKIITTGEGGMLTTNNARLAEKARLVKGMAYGHASNRFMHQDIGYNYRMTNIQAAIGCAQLEKIDAVIDAKRKIAQRYTRRLQDTDVLQLPVEKPYARNVYWMYHVVLKKSAAGKRRLIMEQLLKYGIETRESFVPYNMQEIFIRRGWTRAGECPNANDAARNGFYIPSGASLSMKNCDDVAEHLKRILKSVV